MKKIPKKIWIPSLILLCAGILFFYNRPTALQKAVLMSTPLIFREGSARPYDRLPPDISPPVVPIFFATDRQPSDLKLIHPIFYGNKRSMTISMGEAHVRFGNEDMVWEDVERASLKKDRHLNVPLQIERVESLHTIGAATERLEETMHRQTNMEDQFFKQIQHRLDHSKSKDIFIFVPGFRVDFAYPVLVAAELWHYMGYEGAFIAYSWPSGQKLLNYLSDVETTAFSAQHFRLLLIYLARHTNAEHIHILCYSAGARIVSQALHELRLMGFGFPASQLKERLRIGQVIFAAPDIDLMLFAARYRDRFEDIAETITIYTNANDTALNWALRFFGWPRLGAPGDFGLNPKEVAAMKGLKKTVMIDVAAAEDAAAGNGHGYFVKSPWVSTDLLMALRSGAPPAKRGLTLKKDSLIWKFSDNYPKKVKAMTFNLPR